MDVRICGYQMSFSQALTFITLVHVAPIKCIFYFLLMPCLILVIILLLLSEFTIDVLYVFGQGVPFFYFVFFFAVFARLDVQCCCPSSLLSLLLLDTPYFSGTARSCPICALYILYAACVVRVVCECIYSYRPK